MKYIFKYLFHSKSPFVKGGFRGNVDTNHKFVDTTSLNLFTFPNL